ncbi:MAG: hypothetical protein OXC44_03870 [Proteobacteria bacterium]|nr:hypothetical protein [Pseudomonadota bacterium]
MIEALVVVIKLKSIYQVEGKEGKIGYNRSGHTVVGCREYIVMDMYHFLQL